MTCSGNMQVRSAALRWLGEHFGAESIGVCDRTIDIFPSRPPRSEIEAMELAVMVKTYSHAPSCANVNIDVPDFAFYLLQSPIWSLSWID